jgi:hypothetical protein
MSTAKHADEVWRRLRMGDTLTHARCAGTFEEHISTGNDGHWLCGVPTLDTVRHGASPNATNPTNDIAPSAVTHINRVQIDFVERLRDCNSHRTAH